MAVHILDLGIGEWDVVELVKVVDDVAVVTDAQGNASEVNAGDVHRIGDPAALARLQAVMIAHIHARMSVPTLLDIARHAKDVYDD